MSSSEPLQKLGADGSVFVRASEAVATGSSFSLEGSSSVSASSANHSSLSRGSVFVSASSLLSDDSANTRTHNSGSLSVSSWKKSSHLSFVPASKLLSLNLQTGKAADVSHSGPLPSQVRSQSHGNPTVTIQQKDVLENSAATVTDTGSCCPAEVQQSRRDSNYPAVRTYDKHYGSDERTVVARETSSSPDHVRRPECPDQTGGCSELEHGWYGRGDFGLTSCGFRATPKLPPPNSQCTAGGPQSTMNLPEVVEVAPPNPRLLKKSVCLPDGDVRGKGGSKKRKAEVVASSSTRITNFFEK